MGEATEAKLCAISVVLGGSLKGTHQPEEFSTTYPIAEERLDFFKGFPPAVCPVQERDSELRVVVSS